MMESFNWMRSGETIALGWTLLHFCWQGTVLAMLYSLVRRFTTGAPKSVRYGIGMTMLALMTLTAVVTFIEQERRGVHIVRNGQSVAASELGSIHRTMIHALPLAAPALERGELWIGWNSDLLLPWVARTWMTGVLLLAFRALGGWWRLEQIRREAGSMIPVELEASFRRLAMRLHIGRKIVLYLSDEVISPLAMGVWRIAIIFPVSAVMQLSPAQLEAVLAHEMAHVRRWDYLGNLLQTAVECLFFFHPAVWWVSRCTRDLRELCCDEVAVRSCANPAVYVEALLQLEEERTRRLHLATALHGHGGSLLRRVRQIIGEEVTMERQTMCGARIGVVGGVVLALILGPTVANGLRSVPTSTPPPITQTGPPRVEPVAQLTVTPKSNRPLPLQQGTIKRDIGVTTPPAPLVTPGASAVAIPAAELGRNENKNQMGTDYLDRMRAAGYRLDLNKDLDTIIFMRSLGLTPDYAKAMAQAGLGTPSVHDLISLKAVGVTPEYVAGLKNSGIAATDFQDVISERSLGITPEYARAIAALGLGAPTVHDLVGLKAQGITPEFVTELKASGIDATDLHDLVTIKAVGLHQSMPRLSQPPDLRDCPPAISFLCEHKA